jgi:tetratricopeptide (TPR) repeat protein
MKTRLYFRPVLLPLLLGLGVSAAATAAQNEQTGTTHKHYDESPTAQLPGPQGELAPRLQNLGDHVFPVSTRNTQAQVFINQGLKLAWAFNHGEARRAFREAARLDPGLAMAYWGQALVLGPNINALMEPNEEPGAWELARKAESLAAGASPREQALIGALLQRYSGDPKHRKSNDRAYADAMRAVHAKFPEDQDIAVLYVESMMDLRPWGYWMPDGSPHEGTAEIVALVEQVIARNPKHPGALHLHIHLLEPTPTPERAERSADALQHLMPAAGHMVHMPSHIYQRVGRYGDALKSNELAVAADEDYITQCRAQGLYPMAYYPHNIHFMWFAAMFDGQLAVAREAGRKVASKIDDATLGKMPMLAGFRVVPYWTLVRFGQWDEILKEPAPPAANAYLTGAWQYARGQAYVATGRIAEAKAELAALEKTLQDPALQQPLFSPNSARAVLSVGAPSLAGEIAAAEKRFDDAVAHLDQAVRLEEALVYTEPSEWAFPPRHALGAVLLAAGRASEAENVFWQDLKRHRENGWALTGLAKALRAQDKRELAAVVEKRLAAAWARADVKPDAARFGHAVAAAARP